MKKLGLLLTSAAMTLLGAGAAAADTVPSGFYIGGSVGWDSSDPSTSTAPMTGSGYFAGSSRTSIASQVFDLEDDGFNATVQAGGVWITSGGFGWGFEGDWTYLDRGEDQANTVTYPCCAPDTYTYGQSLEQEWMASIRARLGFDLGGMFVYGTAGAAFSDVSYTLTFSDTFNPIPTQTFSNSDTLTGWTGGAGVETGLGGALSLKAEYLYTDLGDIDANGTIIASETISSTAELESHLFRVGLNWHF